MSQQPDPNQRLNIDNASSIQDSQIGQAGGDLTQIQGEVIYVTVSDKIDVSGWLGKEDSGTSKPLTQQDYHNRKVLLNKVKNFWIEGVLEKSLHTKALIELGLEERLDVVERPFSSVQEIPDALGQALPVGTDITQVFERMGEGKTLLILGEPGAGKTTILLKILQDLIACAGENLSQPIPVVFNLSSWASKQQAIADWLVQEFQSQYQVSKKLGKAWVQEQQLLLLLDGLDEVKAECRESCVRAINQFIQAHGQTEIVICSRIKDYEVLSTRLQLQGAISIQALTLEQINQYLEQAGNQLEAVKALLQEDTVLQELAKSPLMLSIMSLTYQGDSVENLTQIGSINERRHHIFTKYVERMFKRRGVNLRYPKVKVMRCLIWLAQSMSQESQTVFLIERMQPTWLQTKTKIIYRAGTILNIGLIFGLINVPLNGLVFGLVFGLIFGLIFGLTRVPEIRTIETLKFSWKKVSSALIGGSSSRLIARLIVVLFVVLNIGLIAGLNIGLIAGLNIGLIIVLFLVLNIGLNIGLDSSVIKTKTIPNEGIWKSFVNAGIIIGSSTLIVTLIYPVIFGLFFGLNIGLSSVLSSGLKLGLFFGLSNGLFFGGNACIQHLTLRLILYHNGFISWNYARFLDYATERIFLQKVGGGYIFTHRMLREHFAQMELDQ